MPELDKMKGVEYSIVASRGRTTEGVYLAVENADAGAYARLFPTREEARAIAAELLREADWLATVDLCAPREAV